MLTYLGCSAAASKSTAPAGPAGPVPKSTAPAGRAPRFPHGPRARRASPPANEAQASGVVGRAPGPATTTIEDSKKKKTEKKE
ncbi:unnamed protein product [Penicillium viridicatum]